LKTIVAVPPRVISASRKCIDLSDHYNARLDDDWLGQRWTLAKFQPGLQTLGGIEFDVRGAIQLSPANAQPTTSRFSPEVRGISVSQSSARLHFLHGCINRSTPGIRVALYLIHYANGERVEVPVVYGEEVRDTLFVRKSPTQAANASIVWQTDCDQLAGHALRLFHFAWKNPYPNIEIRHVDFLSGLSSSTPFLVAITAE
jgi:hypothetical protein